MKKFLIPLIVVLAVTGYQSLFIVQEINQAIVLQFGDPKKIITKPGLNFKLPFIQNVAYLDRRVLNLDTPPEEVIACLLYTSPSPRDRQKSRMPSSA